MTDPSPPIAPQPAPPRVAARAAPPRRQRALTAAVALAAVVSLGYLALRPAPPGASGVRPVDPVTVPAVPIEGATGFVERRTHVGRVEAARVSRIGSELGGAVLEMLVDEGDRVTPGQPLARFDTARLRARRAELDAERLRQEAILAELRAGPRREDIDAQKAQCARLDAAAALARATAARVRAARDHDAVSAQEWDAARLQAEQAEAA
ncbi:MAG: biotin/lipoyl-binding protein, partial [Planctomycetota bacterium]